ncbi:hypothetical protein PR003_g4237 [Phytophthora rubi]|uniref:Uncharacterized protein n=1 Tax=Phytophthora rubi TaxID=129364 RepID=A0A6A4G5F5_9STRA|nr:hypothetical protein PR003_g4237 [Phytophthora rubi]
MLLFCVYQPNVTSSSRRPSPGSSGGSGGSTASPPPAASMGTTASSKLGPAQARSRKTEIEVDWQVRDWDPVGH